MIMVFIPNNPLLSPNKDGTWTLMADWRVWVDDRYYTIPQGFTTDGASIPRFLWRLCGHPMEAPRLYLAIIHDWFYSGGCPGVTRTYADAVFRDGQICVGGKKTHAYVEWLALRLCGWTHWKNETKRKVNQMKLTPLLLSACCLSIALLCGCATKTRNVEIDGMFAQAESATLAIGSVDVMAAPIGEESAIIKYGEDTAWLHPETKTHSIRIQLTGSNCVEKVDKIVENICRTFIPTAAIVNGAKISATNMTHSASK